MKKKKERRIQRSLVKNPVVKSKPVTSQNYYKEVIIVLVITFFSYLPVLKAGFVNWDDPDYINEQLYKGLSSLNDLITKPVQGNYHPLTMLSLAFNYFISGMDGWSYHLLNLLLHLINCVLVFRLAYLLSNRNILIAFVTSILFGIHPMHVESVAWVSERKDVLYSLFFLAGLISYTKYIDNGSKKQYWLTLLFVVLSLLSKPAAVIFPVVLFCIDLLRKRKMEFKLITEKIPFFIPCLLIGILTFTAQKTVGAIDNQAVFGLGTRIIFGFYGFMMYFIKMFLPVNLAAFYPFPPINEKLPAEYYIAPLFFIVIAFIFFFSLKRNRAIAFGLLFFLVNLLLVLQVLPVGSAIIAERYTYIPYIGLFYSLGWLIDHYTKGKTKQAYIIIGIPVLILSILTFRQSATWYDGASMWDQAIKAQPSSKAYDNRASFLRSEKNYDLAIEYYTKAIKLNVIDVEAYVNRGNIYFDLKHIELALADYYKSLSIKPDYFPAFDNIGVIHAMHGKYDSALVYFNKALSLKPDYISSYRNRALVYFELKRNEEAIKDFESFLKYQPNDPDIINTIGICYRVMGKYQESLAAINKALEIKQDPHFYLNRSHCYNALNNKEQAKKDALAAKQGGLELDATYAKQLGIQ